jgi:hypothetical protein
MRRCGVPCLRICMCKWRKTRLKDFVFKKNKSKFALELLSKK